MGKSNKQKKAKRRLKPKQPDTSVAAQQILARTVKELHFAVNQTLRSKDPEGPHQIRISLRRLRTLVSVCRPAFGRTCANALKHEARWLGAVTGSLRDIDVVRLEIVRPAVTGDGPLADLDRTLRKEGKRRRRAVRRTLVGKRARRFFQSLDTWRARPARGRFSKQAKRALDRRRSALAALAPGLATQDTERWHEFRKEVKKLRYGCRMVSDELGPPGMRRYIDELKSLQERFGALNDVETAAALFDDLAPSDDARKAGHALLEDRRARTPGEIRDAAHRWAALSDVPPPWR